MEGKPARGQYTPPEPATRLHWVLRGWPGHPGVPLQPWMAEASASGWLPYQPDDGCGKPSGLGGSVTARLTWRQNLNLVLATV